MFWCFGLSTWHLLPLFGLAGLRVGLSRHWIQSLALRSFTVLFWLLGATTSEKTVCELLCGWGFLSVWARKGDGRIGDVCFQVCLETGRF